MESRLKDTMNEIVVRENKSNKEFAIVDKTLKDQLKFSESIKKELHAYQTVCSWQKSLNRSDVSEE
jgi:hypothetical protein